MKKISISIVVVAFSLFASKLFAQTSLTIVVSASCGVDVGLTAHDGVNFTTNGSLTNFFPVTTSGAGFNNIGVSSLTNCHSPMAWMAPCSMGLSVDAATGVWDGAIVTIGGMGYTVSNPSGGWSGLFPHTTTYSSGGCSGSITYSNDVMGNSIVTIN